MNRKNLILTTAGLLLALPLLVSCDNKPATSSKPAAKTADYNHDMSAYKAIATEAMKLAKENKLGEAFPKTKDLETKFDKGTEDMKKAESKLWTEIDTQMDAAIAATDAKNGGTPEKSVAELQKFIDMLDKVPAK